MQGKTVIANVIRKADEGLKLAPSWQEPALQRQVSTGACGWRAAKRCGATSFEGSGCWSATAPTTAPATVRTPSPTPTGVVPEPAWSTISATPAPTSSPAPWRRRSPSGKLRIEGSYLHNALRLAPATTCSTDPAERQTSNSTTRPRTPARWACATTAASGARATLEVYALQQLSRYSSDDDLDAERLSHLQARQARRREHPARRPGASAVSPTLSIESGPGGRLQLADQPHRRDRRRRSRSRCRPPMCMVRETARRGVRRRHLAAAPDA